MKHLISFLLFLFLSNQIYAGHPAVHILVNDVSNEITKNTFNSDKWVYAPFIGISSHILIDRVFSESGIEYQYQLAAIRPAIMFFCVPDEEKPFFLWESFWALLPDLIDKNFKTNIFHQSDDLFDKLDPGQTNLSEELSILLFELRWQ